MEKNALAERCLSTQRKGWNGKGVGGEEGRGMEARTKSAERSAANPGSAKRYRIFAPFCGSGKRAEKNRCSREKIGLRSQAARKNRAGRGGEDGADRARGVKIGGKPRSDGDKNCM